MHKVAIITIAKEPKVQYLKELQSMFGSVIEFEAHCLDEGLTKIENIDLAIISLPSIVSIAKNYIPQNVDIIYFNRTFIKGSLDKLKELPNNSKVMLVNNSSTAAVDAISLLFEMGITNMDMYPVYPGMEELPAIDIAVTPGQTFFVPDSVKTVIDIGWRVLDISTLMDVVIKLGINDPVIDRKLEVYMEKLIPISHSIHRIHRESSKITNELNMTLDVMDDGVIILDGQNVISHYNKAVEGILNIDFEKVEIRGKSIDDSELSEELKNEILNIDYVENSFIKFSKTEKSLIVTKRPVQLKDEVVGDIILLKDRTEIENLENQLRKEIKTKGYIAKHSFNNLVGRSPVFEACKNKALKMSKLVAPILLIGESGTGKEMFAQSIHNASERKNNPFLGINCATLSSNLIESELFGYEEGAFTGALRGGKKGLFELAHNGSLFLDEVGDLPMNTQVKLLRVLQEKEIMRLGGSKIIPVNVRIIAATNKNIIELIENNGFRRDLYYRLNVFTIKLPALRERKEDISDLIKDLISVHNKDHVTLDDALLEVLQSNKWDGNIRQLANVIEYMLYMGGHVLTVRDLPVDFMGKVAYEDANDRMIKDHKKSEAISHHDICSIKIHGFTNLENLIVEEILCVLNHSNIGRRKLYILLKVKFENISEYKIRLIMDVLRVQELIETRKGRKGTSISEKGKRILDACSRP